MTARAAATALFSDMNQLTIPDQWQGEPIFRTHVFPRSENISLIPNINDHFFTPKFDFSSRRKH